jgi:hypothetical protein
VLFTTRVAAQQFPIDGYFVEGGTRIVVHVIAIDCNLRIYERPKIGTRASFRPAKTEIARRSARTCAGLS